MSAQRPPVQRQSLLASIVLLPFQGFGVLCGTLLLCIAIECMGMHFLWPEQGWQHAQQRLNSEVVQFAAHVHHGWPVQNPGQTVTKRIESAQHWLLKSSLLNEVHDAAAHVSESRIRPHDFRKALGLFSMHLRNYLIAAIYTMLVFAVRLLTLGLTLPLCNYQPLCFFHLLCQNSGL
jgi:integrating conjugative element membrane protein (TIGR03747 family)